MFQFSGIAEGSLPMTDTKGFAPTTKYSHESIYNNSHRVASASSGVGNSNKTYKERQVMIDKLNRILGLTYSGRGLL